MKSSYKTGSCILKKKKIILPKEKHTHLKRLITESITRMRYASIKVQSNINMQTLRLKKKSVKKKYNLLRV